MRRQKNNRFFPVIFYCLLNNSLLQQNPFKLESDPFGLKALIFISRIVYIRSDNHRKLEGGGNYVQIQSIKRGFIIFVIRSQRRCVARLFVPLVSTQDSGVKRSTYKRHKVHPENLNFLSQHLKLDK